MTRERSRSIEKWHARITCSTRYENDSCQNAWIKNVHRRNDNISSDVRERRRRQSWVLTRTLADSSQLGKRGVRFQLLRIPYQTDSVQLNYFRWSLRLIKLLVRSQLSVRWVLLLHVSDEAYFIWIQSCLLSWTLITSAWWSQSVRSPFYCFFSMLTMPMITNARTEELSFSSTMIRNEFKRCAQRLKILGSLLL